MHSRREFLQRLSVGAAALALDPFRGIAVAANTYSNARIGLEAHLPEGWEFSSIADFAALRERHVLQDALDWFAANEPHPLKDPDNLPVFIFEDPRHRDGHFAPNIILYDEPLEEKVPANQVVAHARLLRWLGTSYRDLSVIAKPVTLELHGSVATYSRCTYVHEIDSGERYPLDVRTLLVFRQPRVHTFYLVDSAERPREDTGVWESFVRSIRYTGHASAVLAD